MLYRLPYSKGEISFSLPADIAVRELAVPQIAGIEDVAGLVSHHLKQPLNSLPISQLAGPGQQVVIGVCDASRSCPDRVLLPPLLAELEQAGVRPENICILVATGLHRPSTPAEMKQQLGEEVLACYQVLDHQAARTQELKQLGYIQGRIPAVVNRRAVSADLLIATGIVEPHQYAGYSGGGKTVAIGLAGEATIRYTHSPRLLDLPGTRLGEVGRNPFQQAVRQLARRAGLKLVINVVLNLQGEIAAAACGEPEAVHDDLVARCKQWYTVSVDHSYEVVVAGVGYPKDSNLYQLSRAASYLAWRSDPVVAPGGVIIIPGRCQEGAGYGVGEQRFFHLLQEGLSLADIRRRFKQLVALGGEQRAYVMAQVWEHCSVIVVGADCPEVVREAGFMAADSMEEALDVAEAQIGHRLSEILLVPHTLQTIAEVEQ